MFPSFSRLICNQLFKPLGVLAICLVGGLPASGVVLVSNLAEAGEQFTNVVYLEPPTSNLWVAQQFTAGSDAEINEITLQIGTEGNITGGFRVAVYGNSSNLPGTQLAAFTGPSNPANNAQSTFSGLVSVTSGTNYWVVISINPAFYLPGDYPVSESWQGVESAGQTGQSGWSIANNIFGSFNGGSSWSNIAGAPSAQMMALAAVPEPSRLLLGLLGLSVPLWHRRRTR